MNNRFSGFALLFVLLAAMPVAAEAQTVVGRTAWGDPDLQGVYTFSTNTPLERPNSLARKAAFTESELAELEERAEAAREADVVTARPGELGASYNAFWTASEKGRLTGRTSLIVDPEDGRMPPLTPRAQKVREDRVEEAGSRRIGTPPFVHTLYNTWEDHPSYTRCLSRPMPRVWQSYNHGVQILQTPGQVVIYYESMHDTRVIPLDGRPHIDSKIRQWNGDARGRWEGDTLVVDWTNFSDKQEWEGGTLQGNMRFTERFTKIDANTINYEVTVDDPTTWTRPWTFVIPWRSDDPNYQEPEDLYEFACHEGNYRMMEDSISGTKMLKQSLSTNK
jgi:hypothetical protein